MPRDQAHEVSGFLEFIHALNAAEGVAELLRVVKHRLSATLGVRLYSLFLYTPETRALDLLSSSHVPEGTHLPVNDPPRSLMDAVIANRQPVVIEDFAQSSFASASQNEPLAPYFRPPASPSPSSSAASSSAS